MLPSRDTRGSARRARSADGPPQDNARCGGSATRPAARSTSRTLDSGKASSCSCWSRRSYPRSKAIKQGVPFVTSRHRILVPVCALPTTLGVSPVRRLSLFGVRVKFCTSRSNWSGYRRPTRSRSRYRSRDPPSVHPLTWQSRPQAELFSSPDSSAISAENPDARSARIHHVQRMDSAELQRGLQSPARASASLPSLFQRSETSTREIREEWYET
jgi:hypothetical protein